MSSAPIYETSKKPSPPNGPWDTLLRHDSSCAGALSDRVLRGSDAVFTYSDAVFTYTSPFALRPPLFSLLTLTHLCATMSVPPKFAGLKLSAGTFQETQHTLELCKSALSIYTQTS